MELVNSEYFYPDEFRKSPSPSSSPSWDQWEVEPVANSYSLETFELESSVSSSSDVKMQPSCHVCDSPTANTLHFGGRSCKACAAFFRRSVSMGMAYECIGADHRVNETQCKIHFELRMLCRHCRFIKCLEAGMKKELVQAKKEETRIAKRKSRGLVRCFDADTDTPATTQTTAKKENTASYDEYLSSYGVSNRGETSLTTPKSESETDLLVNNSMEVEVEAIPSVVSLSPPPSAPIPSVDGDGDGYGRDERPALEFTNMLPSFDPYVASTSSPYHQIPRNPHFSPYQLESDDKTFALLDLYVKSEASLNDRRRIMYTDTQIRDVFDTVCECPYERRHLKLFNYRTFCGFVKHDFVMILDYVHTFPEFAKLKRNEKNVFYRMACAVDSMLCSAYYTYRAGINEHFLVLFNGNYIPMLPMPMTGDEPDARSAFANEQDFTKYKTLMPLKLKQYYDMAVPFARLEVSFEEFVLLKALTIWHISNYKLEQGREICARQRDTLVQALHRVVEERGDEDPATRVGQLLLSMSYIMEQVQAMTSSYLLLTFFDVVTCDRILQDLLTFRDD